MGKKHIGLKNYLIKTCAFFRANILRDDKEENNKSKFVVKSTGLSNMLNVEWTGLVKPYFLMIEIFFIDS